MLLHKSAFLFPFSISMLLLILLCTTALLAATVLQCNSAGKSCVNKTACCQSPTPTICDTSFGDGQCFACPAVGVPCAINAECCSDAPATQSSSYCDTRPQYQFCMRCLSVGQYCGDNPTQSCCRLACGQDGRCVAENPPFIANPTTAPTNDELTAVPTMYRRTLEPPAPTTKKYSGV